MIIFNLVAVNFFRIVLNCSKNTLHFSYVLCILLSLDSPIAQSVERRTVNPQVVGSNPTRGATQFIWLSSISGLLHSPIAQSVERRTVNPQVVGSNPTRGATFKARMSLTAGFNFSRQSRPKIKRADHLFDAPPAISQYLWTIKEFPLRIQKSIPVLFSKLPCYWHSQYGHTPLYAKPSPV